MARKQKPQNVTFLIEYEEPQGPASITIDRWALRNGDAIAGIVAREWQNTGRIPKGTIKSVKRIRD